jgi:predicted acetyltransferase
MRRQLREYVDAGVPAAILTASESGIYSRYGYGAATRIWKVSIDRRRARLAHPVDTGSVRLATGAEAREVMPGIHERWRAQTPGALSRGPAWWDRYVADLPSQRNGMTRKFYLLHADGYVCYRVKEDWNDWNAQHLCSIVDYAITTREAHAALWQVLLGLDLFGTIESDRLPLDDPLPLLLTEPRQVRTTMLSDGVWVRPLDVPELLSARRYGVDVDVVFEVTDDLFGDGRYHLQGGPDGAGCVRTDRPAQVRCGVAELGSLYLGDRRLQALAHAGTVQIEDDALARRLDRALLADRPPLHGTPF